MCKKNRFTGEPDHAVNKEGGGEEKDRDRQTDRQT